jgi:signal transduction histidine kinase
MAVAAFLVILTSLVTGILGTTLLRSYLVDRSDTQLRNFAKAATHILSRGDSDRDQTLPTEFVVEIVDANGKPQTTGGSVPAPDDPRLSAAQLNDLGKLLTIRTGGNSWQVIVERVSGRRHAVFAYSLDDLDNTVTRLETADTIAGVIALALLAGIGVPLVRASLAPLRRIEETAEAIAAGDLSQRIDHPPGKTEVGRLAQSLDTMLGTIEAAYQARTAGEERALRSEERMRRFIADASHELRTPLTSVRGVAEYALQRSEVASRDELLSMMALVQQESIRMGRLVEDLLLLARFDTGRPLDPRPVDLASIAAQAVEAAHIVYPARRIELLAAEPVIVEADHERVRQIIDNLLGNALQHTPDGSPVIVTVTAEAVTGKLTVRDQGPGMTVEQASHVFERFYRTDDARARATGGTGLGLAIAASLTAAHDGQITVDTQPGHGAAFSVSLPLATTV